MIRKHLSQARPLPDHLDDWIDYDDRVQQFINLLGGVSGDVSIVQDVDLAILPRSFGVSENDADGSRTRKVSLIEDASE